VKISEFDDVSCETFLRFLERFILLPAFSGELLAEKVPRTPSKLEAFGF
jgi:hypothetical protein